MKFFISEKSLLIIQKSNILCICAVYTYKTFTMENELQPPTKRVCRRSLPPEAINNEIQEYYSGKRVCPGELKELEKFKDGTKHTDQSYNQRLQYLIWIEIRKLKTHHTLLVPGWTGLNVLI